MAEMTCLLFDIALRFKTYRNEGIRKDFQIQKHRKT